MRYLPINILVRNFCIGNNLYLCIKKILINFKYSEYSAIFAKKINAPSRLSASSIMQILILLFYQKYNFFFCISIYFLASSKTSDSKSAVLGIPFGFCRTSE